MGIPGGGRAALACVAAGVLGGRSVRRRRALAGLRDRVVLITGGSRGLGLELARCFASHGARVAVCARNAEQVADAVAELRADGAQAFGMSCDVADAEQVQRWVAAVVERYGSSDVLVANAGTITVGPLQSQTIEDFRQSLDTMFWGVYHPTMAVLPHMRAAGWGRIATIGSIGGKISVPHLLPYSVAKFAAVGFSEGLRAELAPHGVRVTTVVPGLMRTGSHVNVLTKGQHAAEYRWFGLSAALPITSTSAPHAARRIVAATARGDTEVILTWQAQLATRFHGVAPALASRLSGLAARALPDAPDGGTKPRLGRDSPTPIMRSPVVALGERAAERERQKPQT